MNKRKSISKSTRTSVYLMYNGHCAYCGTEIAYKDMQVDHQKANTERVWQAYGSIRRGHIQNGSSKQ